MNFRSKLATLVVAMAGSGALAQGTDADWFAIDANPLFDGPVKAIAEGGDGTLYFGGEFTQVRGVAASNVVRWDGTDWFALSSGTNNEVTSLAVSGDDLYAGGFFTTAGGGTAFAVARWDGSSWSSLGSGFNGPVYALAAAGDMLYAGGYFSTAGGVGANNVAVWDGESWAALGSGANNLVRAVEVSGASVWIGGDFNSPGLRVAAWDGESWSALGSGLNRPVACLVQADGTLFAGGSFYKSGNTSLGLSIAQWNGSDWLPVGSGASGTVRALATRNGEVFAGGSLTTAGGDPAAGVARWDGSEWSNFGSGTNEEVFALLVSNQDLFVGGTFTMAGGMAADRAAATTIDYAPEYVFELDDGTTIDPDTTIELRGVVGETTQRQLSLTNIGNRPGNHPDVTLEGDDSDLFGSDTGSYDGSVPVGGTTSLRVNVTPTEESPEGGSFNATLTLGNEADEDVASYSFPLRLTTADAATLFADAAADAGLEDDDADPDATPFGDGIENLLKYAFNLPLDQAGGFTMAPDGEAGLPTGRLVEDGGSRVWQLIYLRRLGSGLVYTPMISSGLGGFTEMTGTPVIEPAGPGFERVTVEEPVDLASDRQRFSVVEVSLP